VDPDNQQIDTESFFFRIMIVGGLVLLLLVGLAVYTVIVLIAGPATGS
jgi:hypothetical protein